MYISKIEIHNFRNFKNSTIELNEGINCIIGHNNAGKTNLLKALSLIFNSNENRKLLIDDFYKKIDTAVYFEKETTGELKRQAPPKIKISAFITQSTGDKIDNEIVPDDNNTVYNWRIQTAPHYIAQLTFEYFLPDGEDTKEYCECINKLISDSKTTQTDFWALIKHRFIYKYISRIYCGNPSLKNRVDSDDLNRFDFQFLNAIRDVEKELFTGKNTLLKDVLRYFLDNSIDINPSLSDIQKNDEKNRVHSIFEQKSLDLIAHLKQRINTEPILKYSKDVGASLGGEPNFEGEVDEIEMFSTLRLIIEKELNIKLPATHNGLGYNNLIYISILLSKMQMSRSNYVSDDEKKIYPMLVIEEPEAHLHPSMQYKFLKFLKDNLKTKREVRQVFITTHSTHITAAVELDEIICLNMINSDEFNIAYPGKVFDLTKDTDKKSKAYVKRFLDATKSDMLFAQKVIFVEGIAEQILIHCLANYIGKSLEDFHVAVINVNGRYFNHFLKLFDYLETDQFKKNAINRKVVCITDADPTQKDNTKPEPKFKKCFPFELDTDLVNFEYKKLSEILNSLVTEFSSHALIKIESRIDGKGKTFEYELVQKNPTLEILLSDNIANKDELEKLIKAYKDNKTLSEMVAILKNDTIKNAITNSKWTDDLEKKAAIIAARYLQSIENTSDSGKGEHALNLDISLRENLVKGNPIGFEIPDYVKNAINYVCS